MTKCYSVFNHVSLQWCHNEHDGISNHRHFDCFHNHLFRRRSKKISKLRITGLCEGNSQVTGEFQAQGASNVENVSIWWHHHDKLLPMNFQHKGPVTWKMLPFDDIIIINCFFLLSKIIPVMLIWTGESWLSCQRKLNDIFRIFSRGVTHTSHLIIARVIQLLHKSSNYCMSHLIIARVI